MFISEPTVLPLYVSQSDYLSVHLWTHCAPSGSQARDTLAHLSLQGAGKQTSTLTQQVSWHALVVDPACISSTRIEPAPVSILYSTVEFTILKPEAQNQPFLS